MRPIMPKVTIQGDRHDCIMARFPRIVGLSKSRIVWLFGFMEGSDIAKLTGVSADAFAFVLTDFRGKILAKYEGFGASLPKRFVRILNKPL